MLEHHSQDHIRATLDILTARKAQIRTELAEIEMAIKALESLSGSRIPSQARTTPPMDLPEDCPVTQAEMDEFGETNKYLALNLMGERMPGNVLHDRTAARWLISGGLVPPNIDNARAMVGRHMDHRPHLWEKHGPGTHRYLGTSTLHGTDEMNEEGI